MLNKKLKKAFTLVELLVVIAILAILGTVGVVGYTAFINKAHLSNDSTVISELNTYIKAAEYLEDIHTVQDADKVLEESGFDLNKLTTSSKGYRYAFDIKNKEFCLIDKEWNLVNYNKVENKVDIFAFINDVKDFEANSDYRNSGYSAFLQDKFEVPQSETININKGIDVGNVFVKNIVYENTNSNPELIESQKVLIRANSFRTNLSINAPKDSVYHYDSTGYVLLEKIATTSFYEYGASAFIELNIGRVVLTELSDVEVINISKKDANTYNNPIIADAGVLEENMPDIISRDQIAVIDERDKTELVQVQKLNANGEIIEGDTEQVFVYKNGTVGSTEQTSEQNPEVISDLGQIVLDSGAHAGEKAYGTDDKEEVKSDYIKLAKYGRGSGTPEDPYLLSSLDSLYAMSEDYQYNSMLDEYCNFNCYKLLTDLTVENWTIATIHYIELSGSSVMPKCTAFGGQFDGNGHTISFKWDSDVTEVDGNDGVCLFGEFIDSIGISGYDRPGVMKNLTIDCDIDAACDISPMFAYIWGDDCTVENCHIKGTIKSEYYMAGISLYANTSPSVIKHLIKDCSFSADVIVNVKENTPRTKDYFYLSTFICQTTKKQSGVSSVVFENCTVTGSITLPYCTNINHILYGTFYAANNSPTHQCIGTNCIDNCAVNIASQYYSDGTVIDVSALANPNN